MSVNDSVEWQCRPGLVSAVLGRITTLHSHSPALYQIHEEHRGASISEAATRPNATIRLEISGSRFVSLNGKRQFFLGGRYGKLQMPRSSARCPPRAGRPSATRTTSPRTSCGHFRRPAPPPTRCSYVAMGRRAMQTPFFKIYCIWIITNGRPGPWLGVLRRPRAGAAHAGQAPRVPGEPWMLKASHVARRPVY